MKSITVPYYITQKKKEMLFFRLHASSFSKIECR